MERAIDPPAERCDFCGCRTPAEAVVLVDQRTRMCPGCLDACAAGIQRRLDWIATVRRCLSRSRTLSGTQP